MTAPRITTRLGKYVYRLVPSERYRAAILVLIGSIAGYLSPPVLSAFTDRLRFPIEAAAIEQFRLDAEQVNCTQSQDVLRLIIERNQEIRRKHAELELWYTRYFVSSGWMSVRAIPLPCIPESMTLD